jgi:hypothetical protein
MMIADHILVEFLLKEEKGSQRPQASYTESFSQSLIVFAESNQYKDLKQGLAWLSDSRRREPNIYVAQQYDVLLVCTRTLLSARRAFPSTFASIASTPSSS